MGRFSPCLFAIFINDLIIKVIASGKFYHCGLTGVNIILYADDILLLLLLARSITALQSLISVCENELFSLDMLINSNKFNNCILMGHQALIGKTMLSKLVTRCGDSIEWVTSCRYLGVFLISGPRFKCKFNGAKSVIKRIQCYNGKGWPNCFARSNTYAGKIEMCANFVILP